MTFIEALYGSQYHELTQNGKDGDKGRFNGNIFLSAFVVLIILAAVGFSIYASTAIDESITKTLANFFGYDAGKTAGKLLAVPLMVVCYFIISKTVGSERNYNNITERFNALPEEEKKKANKKVLVPFFIVLILLTIAAMSSIS